MLSSYFASIGIGSIQDPAYFAKNLQFTADGYLIWGSIPLVSKMKLKERVNGRDDAKIQAALNDKKLACILQVDGYHWVVATKKIPNTKLYGIADPWLGDRSTSDRYKRITGFAIISA